MDTGRYLVFRVATKAHSIAKKGKRINLNVRGQLVIMLAKEKMRCTLIAKKLKFYEKQRKGNQKHSIFFSMINLLPEKNEPEKLYEKFHSIDGVIL